MQLTMSLSKKDVALKLTLLSHAVFYKTSPRFTCPTCKREKNISKKLASILDVVHSFGPCGPLAWSTHVKD